MSDAATERRTIEDATCLGCACLCDDISLVVEGGRIAESRRACGLGRTWYEWAQADLSIGPMIAGQTASLDDALSRAAEILGNARAPVVLGLGATIEAQRAAVGIADRIGAAITPIFTSPSGLAAYQRLGSISATLGEVRDRADVIVFASPSPTWPEDLPRFLERFVDPPGRFIPEGRAGRTLIVLRDPSGAPVSEAWGTPPDLVLDFPGLGTSTYAILRGLVNGADMEPARFERRTGVPLSLYVDLAGQLKRARYGVLIHSPGSSGEAAAEAALALVRDLNRHTRFVAFSPPEFNEDAGAEAVLAWQAGAGGDVDFSRGHPRHLPREILGRIEKGEADAILFVGDVSHLAACRESLLAKVPTVVVGPVAAGEGDAEVRPLPDRRSRLLAADAFLPTARAGIDEGGTVARFDGVMLPLRPPFSGRRPTQAEVLRKLDARLAAGRQEPPR